MATINGHKKSPLVHQAQGSKAGKKEKINVSIKDVNPDDIEVEHRSLRLTKTVSGVTGQVNGFMEFIREQGVVGLAVGLTLGTAVTVFVKSVVDNVVNPIIGAVLPGSSDLSTKYTCLRRLEGACTNKLGWGQVASNLISFIIIAAIIYFVVRGLKLDRIDKKKDK